MFSAHRSRQRAAAQPQGCATPWRLQRPAGGYGRSTRAHLRGDHRRSGWRRRRHHRRCGETPRADLLRDSSGEGREEAQAERQGFACRARTECHT
eukprot:6152798-Alexandrium_andersonii.AAC.1